MTQDPRKIIIEYPEAFPISGPLRAVFTERLRTFFKACDTWSCSHEGSLPEKLLNLRREMQESIGYPALQANPHTEEDDPFGDNTSRAVEDPESKHVRTQIPLDVRLSWKGLQTRYPMEDLPPAVRDAGLDLASNVLGLRIRYGNADPKPSPDAFEECGCPEPGFIHHPYPVCPFTRPGVISELTKTWSAADRDRLRHQIKKHVVVAAGIAIIVGLVMGGVLTPSGSKTTVIMPSDGHHVKAYAERSYSVPHRPYDAPHAVVPMPQPSQSVLIAQPLPSITPESGTILTPKPGKGH